VKYCLECGRELFDRDMVCDRCNSINLIDSKTCEKIVNEINSANKISLKFLLRDRIYKKVYDVVVNKPQEQFNYNYTIKNQNQESQQEYFDRINSHTINKDSLSKPKVECPYCHSTDTSKIGTVSRMASTGFFGLASKKMGKQWHCNKCGSDF